MDTQEEFAAQPLVIKIERVNGNWDIRPSTTHVIHGVTHSQKMKQRLEALTTIDQEYANRRYGSAPAQPHFRRDPDHIPAVIKPRERVQFISESNLPFTLSVERDPDVTVNMDSPNNPFGFTETVVVNSTAVASGGSNAAKWPGAYGRRAPWLRITTSGTNWSSSRARGAACGISKRSGGNATRRLGYGATYRQRWRPRL